MLVSDDTKVKGPVRYVVTGSAAHGRLLPLLPSDWVDCTADFNENESEHSDKNIDFLWENTPRNATKEFRDYVKCYSHLPNGTGVLDSKFALGRFMMDTEYLSQNQVTEDGDNDQDSSLAVLETHCFRGPVGFEDFAHHVGLTSSLNSQDVSDKETLKTDGHDSIEHSYDFLDLNHVDHQAPSENVTKRYRLPPPPSNLWVLKDDKSNGAGGIWILSPSNYHLFSKKKQSSSSTTTSPIVNERRYVAQRYAWPPVVFNKRKCHVRVYALMTSDGKAYVHRRAFLHVANEVFDFCSMTSPSVTDNSQYEPTVHITNCCANSHDDEKFAGEICAEFESSKNNVDTDFENAVDLSKFFPSICASVNALAASSFPFLQGGNAHSGFEYMGLDFILSYKESTTSPSSLIPIAYLLEVNAPPSQDTATGLPHAENLHKEVISDLLSLWMYPQVKGDPIKPGGWKCVYNEQDNSKKKFSTTEPIRPSKAAILNKVKWALYEQKVAKRIERMNDNIHGIDINYEKMDESQIQVVAAQISKYARTHFPYFNQSYNGNNIYSIVRPSTIFLENAGGAQVPYPVIKAISASLSNRNRDSLGTQSKAAARKVLLSILGAHSDDQDEDINEIPKDVSSAGLRENGDTSDTDDGPTKGSAFSSSATHAVFLGANATSLLHVLAKKYMDSGFLSDQDEIIIAEHNHEANITPWLEVANATGAKVKWWKCLPDVFNVSTEEYTTSILQHLDEVLSLSTKIVVMAHASNVIGQFYDVQSIAEHIHSVTSGKARVVVDGVAAVPHRFTNVTELGVDWYIISCHKLFGPHLGALCGRIDAIQEIEQMLADVQEQEITTDSTILPEQNACVRGTLYKDWEVGTISYEACEGAVALAEYMYRLSHSQNASVQMSYQSTSQLERVTTMHDGSNGEIHAHTTIAHGDVLKAYDHIALAEYSLGRFLMQRLSESPFVRIINQVDVENFQDRLPIICFTHQKIKCSKIVRHCIEHEIIARYGSFLAVRVLDAYGMAPSEDSEGNVVSEGVVRFSIAHYNTLDEIRRLVTVLERLPDWK